jgi:UDP-N-acetylglucosamine--N-acetylmuramyl-(pentapeptide) pyrophosphoryl-undecaprenol N-acetylglucosamine transferase
MNLLVAGGGTGGHVYPALALIEGLCTHFPVERVSYVGTSRGLEARVVTRMPQIEFYPISARGFARQLSLSNLRALAEVGRGFGQSWQIVRRFQPDLIVGTGGYAAFAPLVCGIIRGIPTVIHEPNARPGLVNRLLAPWVGLTTLAMPEAGERLRARRMALTGTPIRHELLNAQPDMAALGLDPSLPMVLVMGGSRGAEVLNDQVLNYARHFTEMEVVLITGQEGFDRARSQLNASSQRNIHLVAYAEQIGTLLAAARLVVCRAGAVTLAELAALGKPAILIPWLGAADDHHTANARAFAKCGAARLIAEGELQRGSRLAETVRELLADPATLARMAHASAQLGQPDALHKVIREVERYLHEAHEASKGPLPFYRHRWRRHEWAGADPVRTGLFGQRLQYRGESPRTGTVAVGYPGLFRPQS